jgi:hypothetical protein
MIILAPEIGVAIAMNQYLFARESRKKKFMNRRKDTNEEEGVQKDRKSEGTSKEKVVKPEQGQTEEGISVDHLDLDGRDAEVNKIFDILQKEGYGEGPPNEECDTAERKHEITMTHAFMANMGGFQVKILFTSHHGKEEDEITRPLELWLQDWESLG